MQIRFEAEFDKNFHVLQGLQSVGNLKLCFQKKIAMNALHHDSYTSGY